MKTQIIINPEFGDIKEFAENITANFSSLGRQIYSGRNELRRVSVSGYDLVIKRFGKQNIFARTGHIFKGSKAKRSYNNARELVARGIATPAPAGYIEKRNSWGLVTDSYYISIASDTMPIADALGTNEKPEFDFIRKFARFAVELHSKGILHKDLNNTNVRYVVSEDGEITFSLIDLNRMRVFNREVPLSKRLADITRFTTFGTIFAIFAEEYAAESKFDKFGLHNIFKAKLKHENYAKRKNRMKRIFRKQKGR